MLHFHKKTPESPHVSCLNAPLCFPPCICKTSYHHPSTQSHLLNPSGSQTYHLHFHSCRCASISLPERVFLLHYFVIPNVSFNCLLFVTCEIFLSPLLSLATDRFHKEFESASRPEWLSSLQCCCSILPVSLRPFLT